MKNQIISLFFLVQGFTFFQQDAAAQQSVDKKKFHEDPEARAAWEFERLRDPKTNVIPEDASVKERAFISAIPSRESLRYDKKQASLQSLTWEQLGPNTVGGRTRALVFDVENSSNMLAGAASGGVWRTIDGGESWTKTTSPEYHQTVSTIVQDRRLGKRNTWYYGTGELLSTTDRRVTTQTRTVSAGQGVFKSTDNGSSWTQLASTKKVAGGQLEENFQGVWKLAIDASNTQEDEVYAACYGGIMRSVDGGESWTQVLGDDGDKSFCSDIVITKTGVCYAMLGATIDYIPSQKQGIWRSEDGINWVKISPNDYLPNTRRVFIALAPSNEDIVYFMAEAPKIINGQPSWIASFNRLWRYTRDAVNNSIKWEALHSKVAALNSLGGYCLALAVKPDNPEIIFIGGTNLYRSQDGLETPLMPGNVVGGYPFEWKDGQLHPDIHSIVFHPANPNRLYIASDGGIAHTQNCKDSVIMWSYLNNGYSTTQFYAVAMNHFNADDDMLIGGLQDNGTMIYSSKIGTEKNRWEFWAGGDGMHCAIGPERKPIISSFQAGNIMNDSGVIRPAQLNDGSFLFYTNFAWDNANFDHLYLPARNQLWKLDDPKKFDPANWSEMPLVRQTLSPDEAITCISSSKFPAHRLYIGTDKGRVLRIDNSAMTPQITSITDASFPAGGFVSWVDVNEANADKIVAVFSNYNVPSIFSSNDGGATWTHSGGNLDAGSEAGALAPSIRAVKSLNLGSATMYFAATSSGLFSTEALNGSQTSWLREGSTSIGSVQIEMVDARSNTGEVAVATHGSGIYRARISTSALEQSGATHGMTLEQNYPNPASSSTLIRYTLPVEGHVNIRLYSSDGMEVQTLVDKLETPGEHFIQLNENAYPVFKTLTSGKYFYRMESNGNKITRSLELLR